MNRRISIIVVCTLVLSLCAGYLVYRSMAAGMSTQASPRTVPLVVAARDLAVGTLVRDSDLKMAAWPGALPAGALRTLSAGVDRGVASPIFEGEPVTENRLSSKGSGGGLSATIPLGMRACAVRVNEVVGVAGFAVPGMRVDVLISGVPPGVNSIQGPRVRTLLEDIQVLSAGTNFLKDREGKPEQAQVVNLLVTPAQAEMLSLASNETHIQLILRNPMDTDVARPPGTVMSDLFGGPPAPEPVFHRPPGAGPAQPAAPVMSEPPAPRLYNIEVLNGSVHTLAKFARPAGEQ
jgi:pilus assembly protein CpaB